MSPPSGYTAAQVRAAEAPLLAAGEPLMLRAAAGLAAEVSRVLEARGARPGRVLVLAGSGDNGGDALHAAAILARVGTAVEALLTGSRRHEEGYAAAEAAGVRLAGLTDPAAAAAIAATCDVVVDGIVGTGTSGEPGLRGTARDVVRAVRRALGPAGPAVVAADIPSGIGPDDGAVVEPVLPADITVTFGAVKAGLLLPPASAVAGRVVLVDLGLGPYLGEPAVRVG